MRYLTAYRLPFDDLTSVHSKTTHCHSESFGKLRINSVKNLCSPTLTMRFFVVPLVAGLLRMTSENTRFRMDTN
jgi:hypothetical protein